jgi:hypothetical protein
MSVLKNDGCICGKEGYNKKNGEHYEKAKKLHECVVRKQYNPKERQQGKKRNKAV